MKLRDKILFSAICVCAVSAAYPAAAQDHMSHPVFSSTLILNFLEIPFLLLAIVYAWRTARALQGGIFGRGMTLMAGGMLVMAIGHLLMIADMAFQVNLLSVLFGFTIGGVLWVLALLGSWALLGTGFHSIYKASKA